MTRAQAHGFPLMLFLSCITSSPLWGQLISCTAASGDAYKIFVDDVRSVSSTPASTSQAKKMGGLRDFIVENLRTMSKGRASVVPCIGRFPSDASLFTDDEFDSLDRLRVLLEVWGAVEDPVREQGALGFVLVPARQVSPPAVFVFRRTGGSFLSQAGQGAKLQVFTPVVLGLIDYQNLKYEEAIPNLCEGQHKLTDVINSASPSADPQSLPDQKKLLAELRRITSDAIMKARSDPGSRYQLLKPGPDHTFSCPLAGGLQ
jgi:hypothetical protein